LGKKKTRKKTKHPPVRALASQDEKNHENDMMKKKQDMNVVLTFECCSQAPQLSTP